MVEGQRAIIADASDSAVAAELRRRHQPADAEAVTLARKEMIARLPGFKSAQRTRTEELGMAAEAAATIAVLLFVRQMAVYSSPRPVLTCDEPLIELQPDMGQHPLHSGGIWGAPFLLFPLGPRQVLVLVRSDLPVLLPAGSTLTGREALDVNSVVVGNTDRLIVAEPEVRLADQLYIPGIRPHTDARNVTSTSNPFLTQLRTGRRWHGEPAAPQRPVGRLWPRVLPPASPMPEEMRRSLKRLRANRD